MPLCRYCKKIFSKKEGEKFPKVCPECWITQVKRGRGKKNFKIKENEK